MIKKHVLLIESVKDYCENMYNDECFVNDEELNTDLISKVEALQELYNSFEDEKFDDIVLDWGLIYNLGDIIHLLSNTIIELDRQGVLDNYDIEPKKEVM